jgi:hypothetical protein
MAIGFSESTKRMLTGLFANCDSAERAYQACVDRGYEIGQVNVVVSEGMRKKLLSSASEIKTELARRKAEGGELGGPLGGRVGILVAILAAVGAAVAVPMFGFGAGPIAIALVAAGAACVAAGVIAVHGNWGIPAKRIRSYASAIRKGGILIMVEARSDDDARSIEKDWEKSGGRDIHYR